MELCVLLSLIVGTAGIARHGTALIATIGTIIGIVVFGAVTA